MIGIRLPWFAIRAVATAIAVCAGTAFIASAIVSSIRRGIANSKMGEIDRRIQAITPDVQRRDKEVEDLTRP